MDMKDRALELDERLVRNQVYNLGRYLGVREYFNSWCLAFLHPSGKENVYSPEAMAQVEVKPADEKIYSQILTAMNIWDNQ